MFNRLGPAELLLILGVALLFFGPKKLPELGKSLGKGLKEFKKATREIQEAMDPEAPAPATATGSGSARAAAPAAAANPVAEAAPAAEAAAAAEGGTQAAVKAEAPAEAKG